MSSDPERLNHIISVNNIIRTLAPSFEPEGGHQPLPQNTETLRMFVVNAQLALPEDLRLYDSLTATVRSSLQQGKTIKSLADISPNPDDQKRIDQLKGNPFRLGVLLVDTMTHAVRDQLSVQEWEAAFETTVREITQQLEEGGLNDYIHQRIAQTIENECLLSGSEQQSPEGNAMTLAPEVLTRILILQYSPTNPV